MGASFIGLMACANMTISNPQNQAYPAYWWKEVPASELASWEISPHTAGPDEVILSKRNELGVLSNFAATPFIYRGKKYASLEGFWQMMLYPENNQDERVKSGIHWKYTRSQVAAMSAFDAKKAGKLAEQNMKLLGIDWCTFEGQKMQYRSQQKGLHYDLIVSAMQEKLKQNPTVREVLIKTTGLILKPDHHSEPNSPPEWKYYDVWMMIRDELNKGNF